MILLSQNVFWPFIMKFISLFVITIIRILDCKLVMIAWTRYAILYVDCFGIHTLSIGKRWVFSNQLCTTISFVKMNMRTIGIGYSFIDFMKFPPWFQKVFLCVFCVKKREFLKRTGLWYPFDTGLIPSQGEHHHVSARGDSCPQHCTASRAEANTQQLAEVFSSSRSVGTPDMYLSVCKEVSFVMFVLFMLNSLNCVMF